MTGVVVFNQLSHDVTSSVSWCVQCSVV
jgi:hypothetical protein